MSCNSQFGWVGYSWNNNIFCPLSLELGIYISLSYFLSPQIGRWYTIEDDGQSSEIASRKPISLQIKMIRWGVVKEKEWKRGNNAEETSSLNRMFYDSATEVAKSLISLESMISIKCLMMQCSQPHSWHRRKLLCYGLLRPLCWRRCKNPNAFECCRMAAHRKIANDYRVPKFHEKN